MNIELRNVKIYKGMSQETIAFNANVYVDGKKVGEASNEGHGGSNRFDLFENGRRDWELQDKCEKEAAKYTWSYDGETFNHSLDSYIGSLVDNEVDERELKRKLKTQTLFRIPGESYEDGEYHVMKQKYDFTVRDYLIREYGDKVQVINETLTLGSK